ncbi:MAG: N-acetylmuramoyl-L-alanine amidase [Alphaproteobacteria bacterium]|nr:N-acetylmuramoyl-L-alanine amidase [Alphaproteobacteria bacterium]
MTLISRPSPNHDSRNGMAVDTLVIHFTGMRTAEEALERLTDPASKVSAHYTIDEDGTVYSHVAESERAWHAGVSHWRGRDGVNAFSIGIELVNPGTEFGYRAFPKSQMVALAELAQGILSRHAIPARNVVGHSDVAPTRKDDPGHLFDWPWLAQQGIGLWPDFPYRSISNINLLRLGDVGERVASLQRRLQDYGYKLPQSSEFCAETHAAAVAFQLHFRPQEFSGIWDGDADARLDELLTAAR